MNNPSQMLSRAAEGRRDARAAPRPTDAAQAPARQVVASPIKAESVYRQLMRRHDRMASRHIRSRGGI